MSVEVRSYDVQNVCKTIKSWEFLSNEWHLFTTTFPASQGLELISGIGCKYYIVSTIIIKIITKDLEWLAS